MKTVFVVCFLSLVGIIQSTPDKYTSRYDNVDIETILSNRRLLIAYINCVLGKGKCTPEGHELRTHIQDAIETDCVKCTEVQRSGTDRVIGHIVNEEPALWNDLKEKFDPSGKYAKAHEHELRRLKQSG